MIVASDEGDSDEGDSNLTRQSGYSHNSSLICLNYADIPSYLHESAFYKSLNGDDDESRIDIPAECFKSDDSITSIEELANILRTMMYWGLDEIPFSVLDFLHHKHVSEWQDIASNILDIGNCNALLVYFGNYCSLDAVLQSNRWRMLEHWMRLNPPEQETQFVAIFSLVRYGVLEVIQKLHNAGYTCDPMVCVVAAEHGHLHCLKYFHEQSCPLNELVMKAAAEGGHLPCIMYLHKQTCAWDASACAGAALRGDIECLTYLHENGCPWDDRVTNEAASHNHAGCLQYALQHYCAVHKDARTFAAANPVQCLQLLYEYNPDGKWGSGVTNNAASHGQLTTLKYAIEHGCPIDKDVLSSAVECATHSALPCLQYLIEDQLVYMDTTGFLFSEALIQADYETVCYLVDIGCACVFRRVRYVRLDTSKDGVIKQCIVYMVEHGWPCGAYLIHYVFTSYLPLCQEYLRSEGYTFDTTIADITEVPDDDNSDTSSRPSDATDSTNLSFLFRSSSNSGSNNGDDNSASSGGED